ncbi:hypothetical protein [Tenggerimyces flavus]|uniref:Uncharacterized protein n=1 Tax=Tenggerimyces flavus TaxID=1708749 RepID=A0ABV7Y622_9ACTN|nr:hypothetical protein [Tenggerimyces flavus]MBM7790061.1 hypothetical protein [Tenggerimyces flavus]
MRHAAGRSGALDDVLLKVVAVTYAVPGMRVPVPIHRVSGARPVRPMMGAKSP